MPLPRGLVPLCCLCKVRCLLSQVLPMVKNTLKTKLGLKINRGLSRNGQRSTSCWCSCSSQGQSRRQPFVHPTLMPFLVLGLIKIKSNEIQAAQCGNWKTETCRPVVPPTHFASQRTAAMPHTTCSTQDGGCHPGARQLRAHARDKEVEQLEMELETQGWRGVAYGEWTAPPPRSWSPRHGEVQAQAATEGYARSVTMQHLGSVSLSVLILTLENVGSHTDGAVHSWPLPSLDPVLAAVLTTGSTWRKINVHQMAV